MNKRTFLKSLLLTVAAPSILIPKFADTHKWKKVGSLYAINPDWVNAEYECYFIHSFEAQVLGPVPQTFYDFSLKLSHGVLPAGKRFVPIKNKGTLILV